MRNPQRVGMALAITISDVLLKDLNMQRRYLFAYSVVSALALGAAAGPVLAQGYPNKVIKLQVPFAPGGTTDIVARVISEPLGKALGQSVIVENRAGGGGVV